MAKGFFYGRLAWSNIKKNRQIYLPYVISSVGTVMMCYILSALIPAIRVDQFFGGGSVVETLKLGAAVVKIFSVIFLLYTNSFIIKNRKKAFGLYHMLGMEKKHIVSVSAWETLITGGFSILSGILAGILFSKLIFLALERIMRLGHSIRFMIPFSVIGQVALFFALIFLGMILVNSIQIGRVNTIQLLYAGNMGEKEPKANGFLAVAGVLALGTGYGLSLFIDDPVSALVVFFQAVVLVILGTYLLFTAGMTALLKGLKANKNYYYHPRHFSTVSGLLYRMKQNAAGLATICILSTFVLVMISTTFSIYAGFEGIIAERFPRDFAVSQRQADPETAAKTQERVEAVLQAQGLSPERIYRNYQYHLPAVRTEVGYAALDPEDFTPGSRGQVLLQLRSLDWLTESLASGNAASGNGGLGLERDAEALTLLPKEVFAYDRHGNDPREQLMIGGVSFRVKPLPKEILASLVERSGAGKGDLVFSDSTVLETLLEGFAADFGPDRVLDSIFAYGFDCSASEEELQALHASLRQAGGAQPTFMVEARYASRADFLMTFGGLFFLGIFLGLTFMMGLVLIIYYKQVSEGYDDRRRFEIMQKVGMSRREIKKTIHSQILTVFFLPLLLAVVHMGFALPMLQGILQLFNMSDFPLLLWSTGLVTVIFSAIYGLVYFRTARTYYRVLGVEKGGGSV